MLAAPPFRKFLYEIFLRSHQLIAVTFAYCVWRHVESARLLARVLAFIPLCIFVSTWIIEAIFFLYHNTFAGSNYTKAKISHDHGAIKVRLHLSRPMNISAGQYIKVWIPGVSFWGWMQSHPFVVASWNNGPQTSVDLLIEPRRGFTERLLRYTLRSLEPMPRLALYSGPYGRVIPVGDYRTVVMVASGFGIAAQLPYVNELMRGYKSNGIRTRRVHLIWQLDSLGKDRANLRQGILW